MLYFLHLSRNVTGMSKGPVETIPALGVIADCDGRTPSTKAIGLCLPYCYRKAWVRHCLQISETRSESGFYWTLYNSRGKYLNTIYAIPALDNL